MLSTIASGAFVAAFLLGLAAVARLGRAHRRAGARGRFGDAVDAGALAKHEGEVVTLRGKLGGGEIMTRFRAGLETIDEPHPEAESTGEGELYVACGKEKVPILGAAQVVVGAHEERGRELRRVGAGAEVLARGIVARLEDGAYRDGKARFALAARPDGAWAARPVALAVVERDRSAIVLTLLALACASASGAIAMQPVPPVAPRVVTTCGERIVAKLDRNDIFGAEAELTGCNDARARAETLWSLGRIEEAADAFRAARAAEPSRPVTLSEAEALLVAQPSDVKLLERMREDWYHGPADPSQRALECIADLKGSAQQCIPEANLTLRDVPMSFGNPVAVVTDTYGFARGLPSSRRAWNDPFGATCTLLGCRASQPASLALMAGIAGDRARATTSFGTLDGLLDEYLRTPEAPHEGYYGISSEELLVQDAFAVAAVAAWLVHDEAHTERYLAHAEAHTRDTLAQHLALARDAKKSPEGGDSSKWSVVDLELFSLADHEEPELIVRRLKDLRYTLPLRLHALLGPRPRLHPAARAWIEGEFVPTCRTCGVFELMEKASRRREAARIVGATELESKMSDISRRAGDAWMRDATRDRLWALELLYRPQL